LAEKRYFTNAFAAGLRAPAVVTATGFSIRRVAFGMTNGTSWPFF